MRRTEKTPPLTRHAAVEQMREEIVTCALCADVAEEADDYCLCCRGYLQDLAEVDMLDSDEVT